MSDLLKYLDPRPVRPRAESGDFAQLRLVPFQPEGLALGLIYMGADLGSLPWAGSRPKAGDTVAVIGGAGSQVVIPRARSIVRDPIFGDRCVCRCPGSSTGGVVLMLNNIQSTTVLLGVDGETGDVLLYQVPIELVSGAGIAVDPNAPYDLYILDNRQGTQNLSVDSEIQPDPAKQWYFMLKYALSGSTYELAASEIMPGYSTENPFDDEVNSLSFHDGACWITLASSPATIRKWSGGGFTDLSLTLDGEPYLVGLMGPVVRVDTRPAPTGSYFVLAHENGVPFEVIQFDSAGAILNRLQDGDMGSAKALMTVCNRLYIFNAIGTGRSDIDAFPDVEEPEEPGGGGGEEQ